MLDKYEIHAGSNGEHLVTVEPCKIGDGATASYYGKPAKYEAVIVDKVVTFKPYPWVDFGDVAHGLCGMQSQYCSRYVDGRKYSETDKYPNLGEGLRFRRNRPNHLGDWTVDPNDYHQIQLHSEDAAEFARRVNDYRRATHQIA